MRCRVLIGAVAVARARAANDGAAVDAFAPRTIGMSASGNENDVVSGDGLLMPVRKGQPAPDLRHFEQASK